MYKLLLAYRYLLRRKVSYLAVLIIAVCAFTVMVVMTVMNGLVENFMAKNHDYSGDCVVSTDSLVGFGYYEEFCELLGGEDYVDAYSAVCRGYGLVSQGGTDRNVGVEVTGLKPVAHSRVTNFAETLHYNKGRPEEAFEVEYDPSLDGCIVGIDKMPMGRDEWGKYHHSETVPVFQLHLSCFPLTVKGALAKAGSDLVNTKTYYYSDDSSTGLVKVDGYMIYVPFDESQKLLGMDSPIKRASAIHIKFADGVDAERASERVAAKWDEFAAAKKAEGARYAGLLDNVRAEYWKDYRWGTIEPMVKEQVMMALAFVLLSLIIVFIVFAVFYMVVNHKSKDIGILKSLGASRFDVGVVFVTFAGFVAVAGSVFGLAAGAVFAANTNTIEMWLFERWGWQLWDRSIYAIGDIPDRVSVELMLIIAAGAVAASVFGAVLPALQAAGKRPAEVLQVNRI
jgi:ABC-type lipoprotein release transport system permease subunit